MWPQRGRATLGTDTLYHSPMATPAPTNLPALRFELQFTATGASLFGDSFYQKYSGGTPSVADLDNLATAAGNAYNNALAAQATTAFNMIGVRVRDLINPENPYGQAATSYVGTRAGETITNGVSAHLFYDIDRGYRGARPGSFWPFGNRGDTVTDNSWGSAYITELQDAWAVFQADISALSSGSTVVGTQAGISRITGPYAFVPSGTSGRGRIQGTKRNPALVYNVTATHLTPILGSQRRRLRLG